MTVTVQFNAEDPITYDLRELHVFFNRNELQLVVDGQQLVNVWRPLNALIFPNESLTLTVSSVMNP